jgi:hypothetical protein
MLTFPSLNVSVNNAYIRQRSFLHVTELYNLATIYWFIIIINRALIISFFTENL